ncbi:hypothetical protein FQZ97_865230 [compost metagenome]
MSLVVVGQTGPQAIRSGSIVAARQSSQRLCELRPSCTPLSRAACSCACWVGDRVSRSSCPRCSACAPASNASGQWSLTTSVAPAASAARRLRLMSRCSRAAQAASSSSGGRFMRSWMVGTVGWTRSTASTRSALSTMAYTPGERARSRTGQPAGGCSSSDRRGSSVGSLPKPGRAITGPAPRPTARAWRNACVVAILASTAASAATKPSASAAASDVAKVQPVPWLFDVSNRGRLSQPWAWGVCSQSSERPGVPASPPVTTTACAPSRCRAPASPGTLFAASAPSKAAASRWLGVITLARGSSCSR